MFSQFIFILVLSGAAIIFYRKVSTITRNIKLGKDISIKAHICLWRVHSC